MGREEEVVTRLLGDEPLTTLLTGGLYAATALGLEGLNRQTTPAAFDADGALLPTGLVSAGAEVPALGLTDLADRAASTSQRIEVWIYANEPDTLAAAQWRVFARLQGHRLPNAYPATWVGEVGPLREEGPLLGAWLRRSDFQIVRIRQATV